jgi:hypothetical protein
LFRKFKALDNLAGQVLKKPILIYFPACYLHPTTLPRIPFRLPGQRFLHETVAFSGNAALRLRRISL